MADRHSPVAYRVRLRGDDPEEWQVLRPHRALDFLERDGWEAEALYSEDAITALRAEVEALKAGAATFQSRVQPWMDACFGPEISSDRLARGDRLLEEVLELLQSGDYPAERIASLTEYVWSRDKGEPVQEVGGVMVTLAAYCLAHGIDMHEAGETELARVWTKVEKIRAKQAAKPKGSALPQEWPPAVTSRIRAEAMQEAAAICVAFRNQPDVDEAEATGAMDCAHRILARAAQIEKG